MTMLVWIVFIPAIMWLLAGGILCGYNDILRLAGFKKLTTDKIVVFIVVPLLICAGCISYLFGG